MTIANKPPQRDFTLDFVKGALVMIMVLYHWLNYFVGDNASLYKYLCFLPPSFIFIAGFLVAQVYIQKDKYNHLVVYRRLLIRGAKIFCIFIVLNTCIGYLTHDAAGIKGFTGIPSSAVLQSVFISGNMAGGRTVAFYILIPISYMLILSAILLCASKFYKYIFHIATVCLFIVVFCASAIHHGSDNLDILAIGLLGISIGHIPINKICNISRWTLPVVLAYAANNAAISVWNARYPLQVIEVILTLMLLYIIGTACRNLHRLYSFLILLGRYSFLGYIAQIAILQLLHRLIKIDLTNLQRMALLFSTAILTAIVVIIVDSSRKTIRAVNYFYSAVFS